MSGALTLTINPATRGIAAPATLGVILRPFSWSEAVWAVLGAAARVPGTVAGAIRIEGDLGPDLPPALVLALAALPLA